MRFASRLNRTRWLFFLFGSIPEILIAAGIAKYLDGEIIEFLFALAALESLYIALWLKSSLVTWTVFSLGGRKLLASVLLDYLRSNKYPEPGDYERSAHSYLQSVLEKKPPTKLSVADIPGAVAAALPQIITPQLATLAAGLPSRGEWLYEIKFDGYRILTRFQDGKPALITRRGNDWSSKMPQLAKELKTIGIQSGWLDGEIVVFNQDGVPDFNALQNSMDQSTSTDIVYFLFDVPLYEGYDLRQSPLSARRALLQAILADKATEHIRFSDVFEGDPKSILASACRMHLEGIIAKRVTAPYQSRRTDDWLKLKCKKRQEFVILGYHDRAGAFGQVGSLILGVYADGQLIPAGSVGTGWNAKESAELKLRTRPIASLINIAEPAAQ